MADNGSGRGPCSGGLTAACFARHPDFARQAFAYRLLHTVTPKPLARKLPEILSRALIGEGAQVPPGWNLPPGTVVPPGTILPSPPDAPIGETPGTDLQDGARDAPGSGPGTQLPSGTLPPPFYTLPHGPVAVVPPLYIPPWSPGPATLPVNKTAGAGGELGQATIPGNITDGRIRQGSLSWAGARDAVSGSLQDTSESFHAMTEEYESAGNFSVGRAWFFFDLLANIPAGATILGASLTLNGSTATGINVCIVEGTAVEPLADGDFDEFTGGLFDMVSWVADTYPNYFPNVFSFNALGLTYLQGVVAGTACICCRGYDYDYLNVEPSAVSDISQVWYANAPDPRKPTLVVDYTV